MERIVVFGASRGLGRSLVRALLQQNPQSHFLLLSRKVEQEYTPENYPTDFRRVKLVSLDFTETGSVQRAYEQLILFRPHRFFYVAGGGPYGPFHKKQWKDHEWALRVNFLFPAELMHQMLKDWQRFHELKQMIFIGSAIAEDRADPGAVSYAAGKHALIGLMKSLQAEQEIASKSADKFCDLRVFSPGYIDTAMLPVQAAPREQGAFIADPNVLAAEILSWASDTGLRNQNFKVK